MSPEPHPLVHRIRDVPAPVGDLVLLHGRGTDENDLFDLFDILDPGRTRRGITVGAPFRLPPGGKHWYVIPRVGFPDPETFAHSFAELQRHLGEELGVDWERAVLGGFSQGTVMAYSLALGAGRPSPAGVLALSGFIPTTDAWAADLAARRDLPVFIYHGAMDPIIDVAFARDAAARLREAGADVEYHETPMPHTIDPRVIPDAQRWLAARAG